MIRVSPQINSDAELKVALRKLSEFSENAFDLDSCEYPVVVSTNGHRGVYTILDDIDEPLWEHLADYWGEPCGHICPVRGLNWGGFDINNVLQL